MKKLLLTVVLGLAIIFSADAGGYRSSSSRSSYSSGSSSRSYSSGSSSGSSYRSSRPSWGSSSASSSTYKSSTSASKPSSVSGTTYTGPKVTTGIVPHTSAYSSPSSGHYTSGGVNYTSTRNHYYSSYHQSGWGGYGYGGYHYGWGYSWGFYPYNPYCWSMWHPYSWLYYGQPVIDGNGNPIPGQVVYQANTTGWIISSVLSILFIALLIIICL